MELGEQLYNKSEYIETVSVCRPCSPSSPAAPGGQDGRSSCPCFIRPCSLSLYLGDDVQTLRVSSDFVI